MRNRHSGDVAPKVAQVIPSLSREVDMIARPHITAAVVLSVEWLKRPSREEPEAESALLTPELLRARRIGPKPEDPTPALRRTGT